MRIGVIGVGYVGLVHAISMAEFGMATTAMDIDQSKIEMLNRGILPIYEENLEELFLKQKESKGIRFTTNIKTLVEDSDVIFIAVGTPPKEDGSADLQYVIGVAKQIGSYINNYKVIVNKSTVPVGTGKLVKDTILEEIKRRGLNFTVDVVSNPEFLREGRAVNDCLNPDRIVIGSDSMKAVEIMKEVYGPLIQKEVPFMVTSIETAELIKYASNAFLAVKISFINDLVWLSEKVGADIIQIARGMGLDHRISPMFLNAGPGYGGSCFPKDTKAIAQIGKAYGERLAIIEAAIDVNERQREKVTEKIIDIVVGEQKQSEAISYKRKVAVWGLSFKPGTDDMREAPSIDIIRGLVRAGLFVNAYCPKGMKESKWRLAEENQDINYCNDEYEAVADTEALIIITEWNEFKAVDMKRVKEEMKVPRLFDLRNIFYLDSETKKLFDYYGTGY